MVRRPIDYGLDHRHAVLKNVLEFTIRHPNCVRDSEASAGRKIRRCLESSRARRSDRRGSNARFGANCSRSSKTWRGRNWTICWASKVDTGMSAATPGSRKACVCWRSCGATSASGFRKRGVCVKCGSRPPRAAVAIAAARVESAARPFEPKRAGLARGHHREPAGNEPSFRGALERIDKTVCRDQDGNTWMIKYKPEGLMNPVLASIFTRLSGCPGAEVCPSFLDYDQRAKRPCSVQPYISARSLPRRITYASHRLSRLIDGDRRRASQILCQAVAQWISRKHRRASDDHG